MGSPPLDGALGESVVVVVNDLRDAQGVGLRRLSVASGVKLTRLGDVLSRGRALTVHELDLLAQALHVSVTGVLAEAEVRLGRAIDPSLRDPRIVTLLGDAAASDDWEVLPDGSLRSTVGDDESQLAAWFTNGKLAAREASNK